MITDHLLRPPSITTDHLLRRPAMTSGAHLRPPLPHYKVVLLGNTGVGKTVLVERVTEDIFHKAHIPTIGAQFTSLEMRVGDRVCILELWDTAGQEEFRALVSFYARDAHGALLLYDITNRTSFVDIRQWLDFIRRNSPDVQVILFGNKIDLTADRTITRDEGEELAQTLGIAFMEGSAKTTENIQDAFEKMTDLLGTRLQPKSREDVLGNEKTQKDSICGC
jgi:small GTP-binding protein